MIRCRDPKVSLDFYVKKLGMHLVWEVHYPKWGFSIFFVAYCDKSKIPHKADLDTLEYEKAREHCFMLPGCTELKWNHGSEKKEGLIFNTGNSNATGT